MKGEPSTGRKRSHRMRQFQMLPAAAFSSMCIRFPCHLNNGPRVMADSRGGNVPDVLPPWDIKMDRFAVSLTENDKVIG